MQWMASPGPVKSFLWQIWHLKCFAFWCWIKIFSSSNSRLQYLQENKHDSYHHNSFELNIKANQSFNKDILCGARDWMLNLTAKFPKRDSLTFIKGHQTAPTDQYNSRFWWLYNPKICVRTFLITESCLRLYISLSITSFRILALIH